ncbi:LacI family DNA-binding transcriptional regulator [Oceanobacillus jeddahense]|uniref:LacI family DNA-binding transcriptional regulator n=1 Tax=Oceanobacillus jeddahense TaxID=1462527 RepID=UPI0005961B16|nr:LacI family DNA-binding transcriptional regulator [Oceanobacillus jeddahense]
MKLTIKNIAEIAGVSPATVSKVMNNYSGVSEETKKRVLDAIKENKYQPTYTARTLSTKKSKLIALIYAGKINVDFNHPFFSEVVSSFKKAIGMMGYDIIMFSDESFGHDNGSYLARCRYYHVEGCVIIAGDEIEESIQELVESGIPCVGIDIELSGPRVSYVMTDNIQLSTNVVHQLYLDGVRDIGYIGGLRNSTVARNRKTGFENAMKQLGMEIEPNWMQYGDYYEESGYLAMRKILDQPTHPKAVFAISDLMAFGALKAIEEVGLQVPHDMRIIGCDDINACRYSSPKLSTVKQYKGRLGKLAANILHDLIASDKKIAPVLIDSELIIRES